ncbi:MAG: alpha/beta hydrolase [Candidatus Paceibacterota bacterium]
MSIEKTEKTYGSLPIHVIRYKPQVREHLLPLVLIHGSWGGAWMWKKYATYFAENGWEVYALDLRGHGKSGGKVAGATMEDYVADVHNVVEEALLGSSVIIGHSMGGLVALMYSRDYDPAAVIAINPSSPKEVMEETMKKEYKEEYTPQDAGMPKDPKKAMETFPDLTKEQIMSLKDMLGTESGIARSERKAGISVPRSKLPKSALFIGGKLGESVPFGIGIETVRPMAEHYKKDVVEVPGASHPGILMGENWKTGAAAIDEWLSIQFEADFSNIDVDSFDVFE